MTANQSFLESDAAIEGDYDDVSGAQDDLDRELTSIFEEFETGGGGDEQLEVRVYRNLAGKRKMAYLFSCLVSDLPIMDRLRDEHEGGDFQVQPLVNGKILRRFTLQIAPPTAEQQMRYRSRLKRLERELEVGDAPESVNPPPGGNESIRADMAAMAMMVNDKTNPQEDFLNMMSLVRDMTPTPEPTPPPPTMMENLREMMELKALLSDDSPRKGAPTSNSSDVLVALIEGVVPSLTAMMDKTGSTGPTQDPTPEDDDAMKLQLIYLCTKAAKNEPTLKYAVLTVDKTPADMIQTLSEMVCDDDTALATLSGSYSGVLQHEEWFRSLAADIRTILTDRQTQDGTVVSTESESNNIAPE